MISQVPEGQTRIFKPTIAPAEEQFFQVWQNWDYQPDRVTWRNTPPREAAPWLGARGAPRTPLTPIAPPEVSFKGPARDVVDFYGAGSQVHFISEALFQLIERIDPGSLEHVAFPLRAQDAELPFQAVMPRRALEAIDTRQTRVVITFDAIPGKFIRRIRFPDGIRFNNEALAGVASFSDIDEPAWYWSTDLIELAKAEGMRGLYAQSVASSPGREIARL